MSDVVMKPTICAIVAVRNEHQYLRVLLPFLAAQQIDVAILDHESTDDSDRLFEEFAGQPVIRVERLPYRGVFSLTDQLAMKHQLAQQLSHDWLVHQDADELLEHREAGLSLRDAIEEADAGGFNALNFEEFVFLPEPGQDYGGTNYYEKLRRYYYFNPKPNRLNRAWKRRSSLDNTKNAGHRLEGTELRIAPTTHVLRHYIVLSEAHAMMKYGGRQFSSEDLAKGWHRNRRDIARNRLRVPRGHQYLASLPSDNIRTLSRACPVKSHYWEWPEESWVHRVLSRASEIFLGR